MAPPGIRFSCGRWFRAAVPLRSQHSSEPSTLWPRVTVVTKHDEPALLAPVCPVAPEQEKQTLTVPLGALLGDILISAPYPGFVLSFLS